MSFNPRAALRALTPYIPGRSIASVQRELGLKKVIKLASNENPFGPSPKAMKVYQEAADDCALYPEGESPELRAAIARFHKIPADRVLVGNGSDELIRLLCEAFVEHGSQVVASEYGFIRFKQQAAMMGASVVEVPMTDWTHDLATMAQAASPLTKLIFIANPNNPTGTYNAVDEIRALLDAVSAETLVILDEAYFHFARAEDGYPDSVAELSTHYPNLVILRTFSKAYGLAGLRVGYAVADSELVGWLDRIRMPFNVNLPAQRACIEALKDVVFVKRGVAALLKEREVLASSLRGMGFVVSDSAANFLFVQTPQASRAMFKALLERGVIVRPLEEYGLSRHLRISVGSQAQNRALLKALEAAVGAAV